MGEKSIDWSKVEKWGSNLNQSPPSEESIREIDIQIATILTLPAPEYIKDWASKRAKEIMRGK